MGDGPLLGSLEGDAWTLEAELHALLEGAVADLAELILAG
jgi:hypothetical protein